MKRDLWSFLFDSLQGYQGVCGNLNSNSPFEGTFTSSCFAYKLERDEKNSGRFVFTDMQGVISPCDADL